MSSIDRTHLALSRATHLASDLASPQGDPDDTVRRSLEAVKGALDCDIAALAVLSASRANFSITESTDPALRNMRLPLQSLAASVASWNRGEVVPDAATDPRRDEMVTRHGLRRFVCTPIRVKGVPRGTLMAAWKGAAATPRDATDLLLLGLFAELIVLALRQLDERRENQAFHERLSLLAARSFDRWTGDELDPALQAAALERGVELEGAGCDPVLPEVARALRAEAVALAAPDGSGSWAVVDSFGLKPELVRSWTEEGSEVRRLHAEGCFARVSRAEGFGTLDQDLRVLIRGRKGPMILHILARSSRGAFSPGDVRCAEMAAVRLGWAAHASAMEGGKTKTAAPNTEKFPDISEERLMLLEPVEHVPAVPPSADSRFAALDSLLPAGWN